MPACRARQAKREEIGDGASGCSLCMNTAWQRIGLEGPDYRSRLRHEGRSRHIARTVEHSGRFSISAPIAAGTKFRGGARALSCAGAGAEAGRARRHLHLPDASRDPAGGSGQLPDLRHGAGTGRGDGRGRPQPRTDRYDPPVLDRPGADHPGRSYWRWAAIFRVSGCIIGRRPGSPSGCSWSWRRRSCSGRACRSSSAAGRRWSAAASTCSR